MWSFFVLLVFANQGWARSRGGASLPAKCYTPSGKSCDWYRECLEKKYPCESSSSPYAIRYAEKFCNIYNKRYSLFSSSGQKWIDGVRKCLQDVLVPLLRSAITPTCRNIRQTAFSSHTPCYLNPGKGAPSICDLGCYEYFKIFWTIKGSFTASDTAWESIKGLWNIGRKCGVVSQVGKCFKWLVKGRAVKVTKLRIEKKDQLGRRTNGPVSRSEDDTHNQLVHAIGSAIAKASNWNSDEMLWISYPDNAKHSNERTNFDIIIALIDMKVLGTVTSHSVNLKRVVQDFASAVAKEKLPLIVHGAKLQVKSLVSCYDEACENTETLQA